MQEYCRKAYGEKKALPGITPDLSGADNLSVHLLYHVWISRYEIFHDSHAPHRRLYERMQVPIKKWSPGGYPEDKLAGHYGPIICEYFPHS